MDREVLVRQMRKVERELRQEVGPLALLMLVSADSSADDTWNVIVSARGFNRKTRAEGIREFVDLLRRTLSKSMWPHVQRVTVLRTDDPFVQGMTSEFHPKRAALFLRSCNLFGFDIPKAVLFTSRKVAA